MLEKEAIEQFKIMGLENEENRRRFRFEFGINLNEGDDVRLETATSTRLDLREVNQEILNA